MSLMQVEIQVEAINVLGEIRFDKYGLLCFIDRVKKTASNER